VIITVEIMKELNACQEGIDTGVALGLNNMEYNLAIQTLKDNNQNDFALWLINEKANIILLNPNPIYGSYRVLNTVTGVYDYYNSLDDATNKQTSNKQEYIVNQKERFSVNMDIDNPDGSITWTPVDPFSFDQEDDYQVFDTFTGQYTACSNLADAKAAQKSIEEQVGNLVPPIQQKISSADDINQAWINI